MKWFSYLMVSVLMSISSVAYAADRYRYDAVFGYTNTEFSAVGSIDFDTTAIGARMFLSPVEYDGNPYLVLPFLQKKSNAGFSLIDSELPDADGYTLFGRYVHEKTKFPVILEAFISRLDSSGSGSSTQFLDTRFGVGAYILPGTTVVFNLILGKNDTNALDESTEGFSIEFANVTKMANGKSFGFEASLTNSTETETGSPDEDQTSISADVVYFPNNSTHIGVGMEITNISAGSSSDLDETLLGFSVGKFFTKNIGIEFSYQFGDIESGSFSADEDVLSINVSGRFGG